MRPYDTVELAVSGRSKCKLCKSKIAEGSPRALIHELHRSGRYWCKYYYHTECLKKSSKGIALWKGAKLSPQLLQRNKAERTDLSRMDLLDVGAAQASNKSKKQISVSQSTLRERSKLRMQLQQLRKRLALRFGFDNDVYMIFNNKTLDALVLDLPQTKTELLKVYGFAQKRTESLGRFILPIMREYERTMTQMNHGIAAPKIEAEDDEDEVIFESHETIEDVVNKIFKAAQERGEVITL